MFNLRDNGANSEGHFPIYLLLLMSQPITSKLAIVASLMDKWVRNENKALHTQSDVMAAQYRALLDLTDRLQRQKLAAERRISELEFDLRDSLDHNERLVELVYNLESSILNCDNHQDRDVIFQVPPPVVRRLSFGSELDLFANEVIEISSDEETEVEPEDAEL